MLYQGNDDDSELFYMRAKIPEYMDTQIKVLYVYARTPMTEGQNMIMMDKYGLEWEMLLSAEVRDMRLTCLGVPIVGNGKEEIAPSDFTYRGVGPMPFVTPMAPPISVVRPIGSGPRVSFVEVRASVSGKESLGFRPKGSMGATSGHPARRVPLRPIPLAPSHTPLITSRFRQEGL